MEVFLFLTLLNASYDNVSFPSSVSMTGDGQNTGMGAGKTDIWRGDLGCFLLVFRVERD
jgi:hypothetical protein